MKCIYVFMFNYYIFKIVKIYLDTVNQHIKKQTPAYNVKFTMQVFL